MDRPAQLTTRISPMRSDVQFNKRETPQCMRCVQQCQEYAGPSELQSVRGDNAARRVRARSFQTDVAFLS